ncbi:MAG: peptidylprolyl isomerase [Turicibacter sp.]|nr:peptidylprolyl isomerase [Turicibacter sp.]
MKTSEVEQPEQLPLVTMNIKDYGTIEAELYPHIAPNTVNNFISLINKGFYDGLTIHRIEKGFVLQGGDPTGNGSGGPGYSIEGEFTSNGFLNELKHTEGVLSMARTNQPNSAGSQFFIMLADAPHLDGNYAAFGKVISGMDIAHKIEEAGLSNGPIMIESMHVETYGVDYQEPEKIN